MQIIARKVEDIEFIRINSDRQINNLLSKNKLSQKVSSKRLIIDQPSIFIAPEIYGTEEINNQSSSAIPFFGLFPDGNTTKCLINLSQKFFGLTALIAFTYDNISKDDIEALNIELSGRSKNFISKIFEGYDLKLSRLSSFFSHLKPISSSNLPLADCIDRTYDELRKRTIANHDPQKVQCEASKDYSPH